MATKRVVTPDNLSTNYFDIGENTSNKIEYKFAFSVSRLKTSTNLPPVVFITDNTKEGLFEYDNTDTTTVGDDIDVIVTNAGRRYKRRTSTTTEVLNKLDKGYTIAQLRTLSDSKVNTIGLFYCIDNGKEGWWKYDSTDTSSTDNLGTVLVTSTGKRLKRVIEDYIYPEWFGAKGDGIQDDTTFLQNFLNYNTNIKKVLNKKYKITGHLLINNNDTHISGYGTILAYPGAERNCIVINSNGNYTTSEGRLKNITIENITLDCNNITPVWNTNWVNQPYYVGALSAMSVDNLTIVNVNIHNPLWMGIVVRGSYKVNVLFNKIDGLRTEVFSDGIVYGGNSIEVAMHNEGVNWTYSGEIGDWKIIGNSVNGSLQNTFPSVLSNEASVDFSNIGILTDIGNYQGDRIPENIIISNNQVKKCNFAILSEGRYNGGNGKVLIDGNTVNNSINGICFYPNGYNLNNGYDFSITNNKINDILTSAIIAHGGDGIIIGNKIRNFGLANQSHTGIVNSGYIAARAYGIYWSGFNVNIQSGSTFEQKGFNLTGNSIINDVTGDINDLHIKIGICIINPYKSLKMSTFSISSNIVIGAKNPKRVSNQDGGLIVLGNIKNGLITNNTITGWSGNGLILNTPYGEINDNESTPSNIKINSNIIYDNNYRSDLNSAGVVYIRSNIGYIDIENNSLYETDGSQRSFLGIDFPTQSSTELPADYINISNNKIWGMKFGDTNVINLRVTGTNIYINNNGSYNKRSNYNTNSSYKDYKGTYIENSATQTTKGVRGWVCTTTGMPGTFISVYGTMDTNVDNYAFINSNNTFSGNNLFSGQQTFTNFVRNNGTISASSNYATFNRMDGVLNATANNDVLVGLDISPTLNVNGFSGVSLIGLRCSTTIRASTFDSLNDLRLSSGNSSNIKMYVNATSTQVSQFFTNGNFLLQSGGTFVDSGDKLQVTGTSLFTDKIKFSTGSNKPIGSFTLIAGTTTVTNSIVTTNSKIFVTRSLNGGTIGNITVTPANGSFTVTSSSNTETSTFDYLIIN